MRVGSLWIGKHVVVPFGGVPERDRQDSNPDSRFHEPWVALSHIAAVTASVRLGTCVAVLPLHQPVLLAGEIAALDVLSGGRVLVGAGVGVVEAEYRPARILHTRRAPRRDDPGDGPALPGPQAGVPRAVLRLSRRRASSRNPSRSRARRCSSAGTAPGPCSAAWRWATAGSGPARRPSRAAELIADLQHRRAVIGKPRLEVTLLTGWGRGYDPAVAAAYEAAGVNRLVVTPWTSSRAARNGIERFAADAGLAARTSPSVPARPPADRGRRGTAP